MLIWMRLHSPFRNLLILAFLLILAALARRRLRTQSRRYAAAAAPPPADAVPTELSALVRQVDGLWADQGLARPASRAPLEHLRGIPPDKLSPQVREVSGKIVECFYRYCFGGMPVSPTVVEELRRELERART